MSSKHISRRRSYLRRRFVLEFVHPCLLQGRPDWRIAWYFRHSKRLGWLPRRWSPWQDGCEFKNGGRSCKHLPQIIQHADQRHTQAPSIAG